MQKVLTELVHKKSKSHFLRFQMVHTSHDNNEQQSCVNCILTFKNFHMELSIKVFVKDFSPPLRILTQASHKVLSPPLFLLRINDLLSSTSNSVHGYRTLHSSTYMFPPLLKILSRVTHRVLYLIISSQYQGSSIQM